MDLVRSTSRDTNARMRILAEAARYDASCASSGSTGRSGSGMGAVQLSGICHSWSDDGRCISLLKILFTNDCIFDCAYCANRSSNDRPRATFTPEELAQITMDFYARNYIEGLFLSSAIQQSPDYTMQQLVRTLTLLRQRHEFRGYIHVKAIPGADQDLLRQAGLLADRVSVNIELPSEASLRRLAPQKKLPAIMGPMRQLHHGILEAKDSPDSRHPFVPAGQSTQLIIGASPDSDQTILALCEGLYTQYGLRRVYYSAYMPTNQDPRLPWGIPPPLVREHRLYQADWLLRFYGFASSELTVPETPNLELDLDPKAAWALRHREVFPVEVTSADYWTLLRIPGVGVKSAKRIVANRRLFPLHWDTLQRMGLVMKRAQYFMTLRGQYYGEEDLDSAKLRHRLQQHSGMNRRAAVGQLPLFPDLPTQGAHGALQSAEQAASYG